MLRLTPFRPPSSRGRAFALALCLGVAGCGPVLHLPSGSAPPAALPARPAGPARGPDDFDRVANRVGPVAEQMCHEERPDAAPRDCAFVIGLSRDPAMPPNAFQFRDDSGQSIILMSEALLRLMTSDDEIATVLGHEAGHQIADHLTKEAREETYGALILGGLAAAVGQSSGGASREQIERAMERGAFLGGRVHSQEYELEADRLGAFLAARAGYDPEAGARLLGTPDLAGGGEFLSTHPASALRLRAIAQAAAEIRRQEAMGLTPRPGNAPGSGPFEGG